MEKSDTSPKTNSQPHLNNNNISNGSSSNSTSGIVESRGNTVDLPIRILVPSDAVGAIIGKGGQTIKQLTQQSKAKYVY